MPKILRTIAEIVLGKDGKKPNTNSLRKSPKLPDTTVVHLMPYLETQGYVFVEEQVSRGRGGTSKHYDLSTRGVMALIASLRRNGADLELMHRMSKNEIWKDGKQVSRGYGQLMPGILNLWDSFGESRIEDLALQKLGFLCGQTDSAGWIGPTKETLRFLEWDTGFLQLRWKFLTGYEGLNRDEIDRWSRAVRANDTLREAAIRATMGSTLQRLGEAHGILIFLNARQKWEEIGDFISNRGRPSGLDLSKPHVLAELAAKAREDEFWDKPELAGDSHRILRNMKASMEKTALRVKKKSLIANIVI
jgi:hypothetical protein